MLIKYDDLPLQQTAESLAYLATSDREAYGRYWFNGFSPGGDFYFGIAFAVYPNRDVMDCALSLVDKSGKHSSFRASRRCPVDRTEMKVGPFTLEILELMRVIRVTILDNHTGITADLTFVGNTPVHEEPTDRVRPGVRMVMKAKRYTQFGRWNGFIDVKGERHDIQDAYGIRDRSWGWRFCGEPQGGTHYLHPSQAFYLWSPIEWEDCCTHYGTWEDAEGVSMKKFGQIFPLYDTRTRFDTLDPKGFREIAAGPHRLQFADKTSRFVTGGEFDLLDGDRIKTIKLEVLLRFHMYGIGYSHPEWGHGFWKGEEAYTAEVLTADQIDKSAPKFQHAQQVIRASMGGRVGYGVLEQAIFGSQHQYGFRGLTDPLQ